MLVKKVVQLAVLATAILWGAQTEAAASAAVKLCGRKLSDIMSRVCHAYNSPTWDDPTVVEQPAAVVRRRRAVGIADECCTFGCTWEQLNEYCAISANSESPLEAHMIADRSAESSAGPAGVARVAESAAGGAVQPPAATARDGVAERLKNAARAAPVVGTVSPLLTWGRTLNTDLPPVERDRYAYVTFYT